MKKSVLLGIVSLGMGAAASYGQGFITLDNYSSGLNTTPITYGVGVPANGVGGAIGSGSLSSAWSVGLYWVGGTQSLTDPAGTGMPIGSLTAGTGPGAVAQIDAGNAIGNPGFYGSQASFNSGSTLNTTLTLEIVVFDSADGTYAAAHYRWHSTPFSMGTVAITSPTPIYTGDNMPAQTLSPQAVVPEPTTMALGGLGLASLLLFRRKQA